MERRTYNCQKLTNLPISNPKPDLYNINAHTKFCENLLIVTQVIVRKHKYRQTHKQTLNNFFVLFLFGTEILLLKSSPHFIIQYGSGKRTNFFFHFADQFYNPRFSAEWFGVNHSEWKSFTRSYALDIPRTFSGPQCTHDIRSACEYLRVAIDYSVQVSLTTQIILSNDDN